MTVKKKQKTEAPRCVVKPRPRLTTGNDPETVLLVTRQPDAGSRAALSAVRVRVRQWTQAPSMTAPSTAECLRAGETGTSVTSSQPAGRWTPGCAGARTDLGGGWTGIRLIPGLETGRKGQHQPAGQIR